MSEFNEISQEDFFRDFKRVIPHFEKETRISNNNIVHFTRCFDTFLLILKNGFRPNFSDEFPVYKKEYKELEDILRFFLNEKPKQILDVKIPMCCFCDIPIRNITKHRNLYGKYGIGLTKQWSISHHISPVLYIAANTQMHYIIYSIYHLYKNAAKTEVDFENDGFTIELFNNLEKFLLFIKPYFNSETGYKYYDEREWRYVPQNFTQNDIDNIEKYLNFDKEDIAYIFVTNVKEKKKVLKNLIERFGSFDKSKIRIKK